MVSEELKKDIGNALAAYAYILNAAALGCQVPSKFEIFKQLEPEEVHERLSKLHEWYQKVSACTLREVKAARDAIKYKEEEVLNYFINRSTNAHAESLNSKLKGFRAQLRGVQDLPFFMFRASMIFG